MVYRIAAESSAAGKGWEPSSAAGQGGRGRRVTCARALRPLEGHRGHSGGSGGHSECVGTPAGGSGLPALVDSP